MLRFAADLYLMFTSVYIVEYFGLFIPSYCLTYTLTLLDMILQSTSKHLYYKMRECEIGVENVEMIHSTEMREYIILLHQ